jgi:hypothetical protein
MVVLQFDDGWNNHYDVVLPILQRYGLQGSFGVVTGGIDWPAHLTREQIIEMAALGYEIHDHTLRHNAAFWGDTTNAPLWPGRIDSSLAIFAEMGLSTRGWNQPGGTGEGWSQQLRDCLAGYYDYAAGRVGLSWSRVKNIHWLLRDDPFCLGRGGVLSWGWNAAEGGQKCTDPFKEKNAMSTKMVDGYAQGLVVVPLFHQVLEADSTAWALAEICSLVATHGLTNVRMADAVYRIQHTHEFVSPYAEQIPNPGFVRDLDGNDRPDGWRNCSYSAAAQAPAWLQPSAYSVVEFVSGTGTDIYGLEPGPTRFRFYARSSVPSQKISISIVFTKVDDDYQYEDETTWLPRTALTEDWWSYSFPVYVPADADHAVIAFSGFQDPVYITGASWRLEAAVPALSSAGLFALVALILTAGLWAMKRGDNMWQRRAL